MSSEALERRESIHKLCVAWMSVPSLPDNAIPASPDDVLWLLAEVARLEQERRDLKRWNTRVGEQLAVAREREQLMREALEAIATLRLDEGLTTEQAMTRARIQMQTFARAALVDEPAAAIGRQAVDDYRQDLAKLAESQTVASVGQPPAADEPGETPA